MKKVIIFSLMMVLLVNASLAISITRELPSTAAAGTTFVMNISVTGSSGSYGVLYDNNILGGCTSSAGNTRFVGFLFNEVDTTNSINIVAPSTAGTCIFTGTYQFATGETQPEFNFPAQTVTITGTSSSCTPSTWLPLQSTKCTGTTFVQTSDCNTTRTATGTKTEGCELPPETDACEFWEKTTTKGCKTAGWVFGAGALIGVMFLLKYFKQ